MAVNNPFKITYGSRVVGGADDDYQLHGPYVLDKSFNSISVTFEVVVVATSYADLQNLSLALEDDFRKRDQTLLIDLDNVADPAGDSLFTYTHGTDILNTVANLSKTGDSETDRGYSRSYSCSIEGELPADDSTTGLRDVTYTVAFTPSQQRIISMEGVYTALSGTAAVAKYEHVNGADAEALTFLTALSGSATYELAPEAYVADRNDHTCSFSRTYTELLVSQTQTALAAGIDTATDIRDHQIRFRQDFTQPGDSDEGIYQLRTVEATYTCAVDISQTTDQQSVFENQVRPHVVALFVSTFSPQIYGVVARDVDYDETAKRMAVSMTFLYQTSEGGEIVAVTSTTGRTDNLTPDITHVHSGGLFDAYVDEAFGDRTRTTTTTTVVVGELPLRAGGSSQLGEGWHKVHSTHNETSHWVGDPSEQQFLLTVVNETLVERWTDKPGGGVFIGGDDRAKFSQIPFPTSSGPFSVGPGG